MDIKDIIGQVRPQHPSMVYEDLTLYWQRESLSVCIWFSQGTLPQEHVELGKKVKASESGTTRTIFLLPSGE